MATTAIQQQIFQDQTLPAQQQQQQQQRLQPTERCVLVTRQTDGFGLTITGDHPVFVNTVKPDGAAFIAGVREGDRVVKVNGMPVTNSNYQEVLRMISGGQNVALTLLGQLPQSISHFSCLTPPSSTHQLNDGEQCSVSAKTPINRTIHSSHSFIEKHFPYSNAYCKRESIQSNMTEPIFSNYDPQTQQREWKRQRVLELSQMLKRERRHLESLQKSENLCLSKSEKLEKALQRINELQLQLQSVDSSVDIDNVQGNSAFRSSKSIATPSAQTSVISGSVLSVHSANSTKVEPVKSWVESGGMHYVQTTVDLMPMEENSEDDADIGAIEESTGPFSNLADLKTRSAHLAVFLSYLLNNSNPSSLLFYLITDSYQASTNTKELRRFAYEIFSTFVIPNAPLQVPDITQPLIQQIDKTLRSVASSSSVVSATGANSPQEVEQLKKLFIQARTRAVGDINERLTQFKRKRALGIELIKIYGTYICILGGRTGIGNDLAGIDIHQLDQIARADQTAGIKIAEQILFRHLEMFVAQAGNNTNSNNFDSEVYDPRTLALIASIATIIKLVVGLKTNYSPWEKLLEKCPTFLTSSKSTMLSKMKPKRTIQIKDHQFSLNPVCLTVYCYQCRNVIWGVNPQAYFCQYCDVIVHKNCTTQLTDHCYAVASQQKSTKSGITTSANATNTTGKTSTSIAPTGKRYTKNQSNAYASASSISLDAASAYRCSMSGNISGFGASSATSVCNYYNQNQMMDSSINTGHHRHITSNKGKQSASSASLTPPLSRSHASTATIIGSILGAQATTGSHSHLNCDNEDSDEASIELESDAKKKPPALPPISSVHTAATTVSSSPASSSKSMLPPPVFSQKFERIIAPDPPVDESPLVLAREITAPQVLQGPPLNAVRTTTTLSAAAAIVDNIKSMSSDSGIGTELMPVLGADGCAISRAQSMKVEATNQGSQIRRNGRGANSLGAADAATPTFSSGISPLVTSEEQQLKMTKSGVYELSTANSTLGVGTNLTPSKSEITLMSASSSNDMTSKSALVQPIGLVVAPQCISVMPSLNREISAATARASGPTADGNEQLHRQMLERVEKTIIADDDSDLEVETEVPPLESVLSWEVLRHLKPKEKKRQEVVNELFHTERTHVRNLKILYKVFYRPLVMQRLESPELIRLLFGNIDELLAVHQEMYSKMRQAIIVWQQQFSTGNFVNNFNNDTGSEAGRSVASAPTASASTSSAMPPYGNIGSLIETIFDGATGEKLMHATALFCQNQQYALDTLRQRYNRSKDDAFSTFLAEAESNPICRKLQLKDMIPVEMQRLVKYPLLLETIAKYTQDPSEELTRLQNGVNCAKKILSAVNTAKRNAENQRRLDEIQKKIDFSGNDKTSTFFHKFDFRNHRLIYEGPLQWRQARNKIIDLHVVLLDHLIVFLTKSGGNSGDTSIANQKLQLKIHEAGCIPIMKLSFVEIEEKQGDKRAFNLLYTCDLRMFELVASTATERKTWHRLIENQVVVSRQDLPSNGVEVIDFLNSSFVQGEHNDESRSTVTTTTNETLINGAKSTVIEPEQSARAIARVEQVQVLTHPNLVTANEIVVEQPRVLEHAQQLQTPMERLCTHDKAIISALVDKHNILSQLLKDENKGNAEELEKIAEMMTGLSVGELKQHNSKELAMSAIVHGNRLLDCINQGMSLTAAQKALPTKTVEQNLPSVPCYKLTAVAAPLMNHLKALMQVIQEQEQRINLLKQQQPTVAQTTTNSSNNSNISNIGNKQKTIFSGTKRNSNNIADLIGIDDSKPPPLPPSSAPPPLD